MNGFPVEVVGIVAVLAVWILAGILLAVTRGDASASTRSSLGRAGLVDGAAADRATASPLLKPGRRAPHRKAAR